MGVTDSWVQEASSTVMDKGLYIILEDQPMRLQTRLHFIKPLL
jgi:hypothetical protein